MSGALSQRSSRSVGTGTRAGGARVLRGCRGGNAGEPAAGSKMAFQSVKAMPRWKTKDGHGTLKMCSEAFSELMNSVKKTCIDLSERYISVLEKQVILVEEKTKMTSL